MKPDRGRLWYRFIRGVAALFFRVIGGPRVLHGDRVPMNGPVLMAPIHMSFLDPPLMAVATRRGLSFMAKEELFRGPLGKLISSLESFPVRRGEGDSEAIKEAVRRLSVGRAVLVFPEGTRGRGDVMGPISSGIAMFARRSEAVVVPCGILGTERAWGKGQKLRRAKLTVCFGQPFTYSEIATGANEKENRELFAQELAARIAAACQEAGLKVAVNPANLPQTKTEVQTEATCSPDGTPIASSADRGV
ncbi:MAG: 1-acyl-sn-glycerol-3-phosphate acyltransferase [Chthonomonas sp.]|nr:1-acyl-sn-glycerol-3-phosphate acyltransferase [Chthonomonas sp.]